jgi:invasion protein IalB
MLARLIPFAAAAAVFCSGALYAGPAAAEAKFKKIESNGTVLKKKAGYWTECSYSALGEQCYTVYMKAENGKFRKIGTNGATLKKKAGQVQVCYWGSNNAEICYWVYSPIKKKM